MAGRERRHEQLLGVPARRVAAEVRVGRARDLGLARRAIDVVAAIGVVARGARPPVAGPLDLDRVVVGADGHAGPSYSLEDTEGQAIRQRLQDGPQMLISSTDRQR